MTVGMVIFLANAVLRAHKRKILSGKEGLIGEKGEAQTILSPNKEGKVLIQGGWWNALSNEEIKKGEKIIVHEVDGLTLKVKKL